MDANMNKIDLTDVTFNIPIKIDSQDRINNLRNCLKWLNHHFDTNIIIFESDTTKKISLSGLSDNIRYYFHQSNIFHRTKYLNDMCRLSKTPYIANYDIDVLFPPSQIEESIGRLRDNKCDGVFPYNRHFVDMAQDTVTKVIGDMTLGGVNVNSERIIGYNKSAAPKQGAASCASVGGCIFWNKSAFQRGGMENENFISYGFEDNERVFRFESLGFGIDRINGDLYHMTHTRGDDSFITHDNYSNNEHEYKRISSLNPSQLSNEVSKWAWHRYT